MRLLRDEDKQGCLSYEKAAGRCLHHEKRPPPVGCTCYAAGKVPMPFAFSHPGLHGGLRRGTIATPRWSSDTPVCHAEILVRTLLLPGALLAALLVGPASPTVCAADLPAPPPRVFPPPILVSPEG